MRNLTVTNFIGAVNYFYTEFYRVATSFFFNFYQVFQISSRFLKKRTFRLIFGPTFSLKLSFWLKTVLNSIKTLKRYCKVTLNIFLVKKKIYDDKKKLSTGQIFCVKAKFYY